MEVRLAGQQDLAELARLLWMHAAPAERARQTAESFKADLGAWWTEHESSHVAFVARLADAEVVGIAWLALVPRVPRPGTTTRRSADIQSVFVASEHRGSSIGSALVRAASDHAFRRGASRVTVHSSRKAVPVYERLGFTSSAELLHKFAE